MRQVLLAVVLGGLLAIGSPLSAAKPDNFLEADGCEVLEYVESLDAGSHSGSWLMKSIFSEEQYTYTYDQTDALFVFAPDGLSALQVTYVNWRLIELGAAGTNRTEVRFDTSDPLIWPFDFDGEIIRGTRYGEGGIGGTGIYNYGTGALIWTAVNHVFCQGHR